jgi:hypothetical protein
MCMARCPDKVAHKGAAGICSKAERFYLRLLHLLVSAARRLLALPSAYYSCCCCVASLLLLLPSKHIVAVPVALAMFVIVFAF